jgi:hypothetical protein
MVGVFLAFATSDVATVRQLGVGLAVAISIDATVVRLILLPFALRLGGRFAWWLPSWLDRRLPVLDVGVELGRDQPPAGRPTRPAAPAARDPRPRARAQRERPRPTAGAHAIAGHRVATVHELAAGPGAVTVVAAAAIVPWRPGRDGL